MAMLDAEQRLLLAPQARGNLFGLKVINWSIRGVAVGFVLSATLFESYRPEWMRTHSWDYATGAIAIILGAAPWALGTRRAQLEAEETLELERLAARSAQASSLELYYGKLALSAKPSITEPEESKIGILPTGNSEPEILASKLITYLGSSFDLTVNYQGCTKQPRGWGIELRLGRGVTISKLDARAKDIQAELGLEIPPIFMASKGAVTCEIAKSNFDPVLYEEYVPQTPPGKGLLMPVGVDKNFNVLYIDLTDGNTFSGLFFGMTGSGKTMAGQQFLVAIHKWYKPSDILIAISDLKGGADYQFYEESPYLFAPIATTPAETLNLLNSILKELERRAKILKEAGCRNLKEYNSKFPDSAMPYLLIYLDEIAAMTRDDVPADLRDVAREAVTKVATLARSFGGCLFPFIQKPLVSEFPSVALGNLLVRIGFMVETGRESHTGLGYTGYCENLLGNGDGFLKAKKKVKRFQSLFVSDELIVKSVQSQKAEAVGGGFSNNNYYSANVSENNSYNPCTEGGGAEGGAKGGMKNITLEAQVVTPPSAQPSAPTSTPWADWLKALYELDCDGKLFYVEGDRGGVAEANLPDPGECPKTHEYDTFQPFVGQIQKLPVHLRFLVIASKQKRVSKKVIVKLLFGVNHSGRGNGKHASDIYSEIVRPYS